MKLKDMTAEQIRNIDKVFYGCDYQFSDEQFIEFMNQQLLFGIDDIDLEIIDGHVLRFEQTHQSDLIYYFEDLITKGEFLSGPFDNVKNLFKSYKLGLI